MIDIMAHKERGNNHFDNEQEAFEVLSETLDFLGIEVRELGTIEIVDLRTVERERNGPAFDLWQEWGADPVAPELIDPAQTYLNLAAGEGEQEDVSVPEETALTTEPTEIVDLSKLEAEKRERRKAQIRDAQQRWRQRHKPEWNAYMREYRARRKQQPHEQN